MLVQPALCYLAWVFKQLVGICTHPDYLGDSSILVVKLSSVQTQAYIFHLFRFSVIYVMMFYTFWHINV